MLEAFMEVIIGSIAIFYVDAKNWSDFKKQCVALVIYWILIVCFFALLLFCFGT